MNHEAVLFHLCEAKEQLDRTISNLKTDPEYERGNFMVEMSHIYHHLNTAWNGQDASLERHEACAHEDFHAWSKFPPDDELLP